MTLLVRPLSFTADGILCQCLYKTPGHIKSPLTTLWQRFVVEHHFCPVSVTLLSCQCWFPKLPQRQRGVIVLNTFSCEPSLHVNYHLKPKWQSCQSVSGPQLLKIVSSSQVLDFLKEKCQALLECHKMPSKNHTPCSSEQHSSYYEAKECSCKVQDQAGEHQTNWTPCLCL